MEKVENIELKPKEDNFLDKLKKIFEDKKKRGLRIFLFILPLIIAIGIFGFISYREVKSLLELATSSNGVDPSKQIVSMNYSLRNNATDIQEEYFKELKTTIESGSYDDAKVAGLVCKNFVADFYTWSNKQGQYDVGGLYYIYDGINEGGHYKEVFYTEVRDTFYKYLSNYISEYGSDDLLEVESVEVSKTQVCPYTYVVSERTGWQAIDEETSQAVYEDVEYDAWDVTCKWVYKQTNKFDTSKYATSMNFLVINKDGRFVIVEASEKSIDARKVEITEEIEDAE